MRQYRHNTYALITQRLGVHLCAGICIVLASVFYFITVAAVAAVTAAAAGATTEQVICLPLMQFHM